MIKESGATSGTQKSCLIRFISWSLKTDFSRSFLPSVKIAGGAGALVHKVARGCVWNVTRVHQVGKEPQSGDALGSFVSCITSRPGKSLEPPHPPGERLARVPYKNRLTGRFNGGSIEQSGRLNVSSAGFPTPTSLASAAWTLLSVRVCPMAPQGSCKWKPVNLFGKDCGLALQSPGARPMTSLQRRLSLLRCGSIALSRLASES